MTTTATGPIRRADIRAAAARGATFLDRAWPGNWAAVVKDPITWWDCPLQQLGGVIDPIDPADDTERDQDRAAFALDLAEGDMAALGFWFELTGWGYVDTPLVRAWERAWAAEIAARRRRPRPARTRATRPPRGPRSRIVRQ